MENITVGKTAPGTTIREDETLEAGTVQVIEKGTIGLTVDTYKNIYKNGEHISREFLHRSVYKPINRVEVHGTKPVDTPVSTEPSEENTEENSSEEENSAGQETPDATETPDADTEYENNYNGI